MSWFAKETYFRVLDKTEHTPVDIYGAPDHHQDREALARVGICQPRVGSEEVYDENDETVDGKKEQINVMEPKSLAKIFLSTKKRIWKRILQTIGDCWLNAVILNLFDHCSHLYYQSYRD